VESRGLIWLVVLLVGCTPAPTPLPVQPIVSPTPVTTQVAPSATEMASLRYGVLPNAADYMPTDAIESTGATVIITNDPTDVDVLVGYGVYDDWETVDGPAIALLLDTTLPPLDDPAITAAVWDAIQPNTLLETLAIPGATPLYTPTTGNSRAQLANAGYPAGITLYGRAIAAPGVSLVLDQLASAGIEVQPVSEDTPRAHLTLGPQDTPDAQALYNLPLSYTTPADIPLTLTADGWPLPAHQTGGNAP